MAAAVAITQIAAVAAFVACRGTVLLEPWKSVACHALTDATWCMHIPQQRSRMIWCLRADLLAQECNMKVVWSACDSAQAILCRAIAHRDGHVPQAPARLVPVVD